MKSLLSFELYKIYRQKSIYIAIILLLGLITLSLNSQTASNNSSYYKEWEGEVTADKYEQAVAANSALMKKWESEGTPLTDEERAKSGVYEKLSVLYRLEVQRQESVALVSEQLNTMKENGEKGYELRKTSTALRMLEDHKIDKMYYNRAPAEMIDFVNTFATLISGVLILIGLSSIFSNEYATGMDQFQLSSKYGRKQVVTAKIIASIIYVISIVGAWVLYNIIFRISVYGGGGWQTSLQEVFKYRVSIYGYDLGTYIMIQIGMHLIGALGLGLVVLLISALCRHTLLSFLISGFIFALPIAVRSIFDLPLPWLNKLLEFSFTDVMRVEELFITFQTINFFGFPVSYPSVAISVTIVLSAVSVYLLYQTMKRKEAF